MLHRTARTNYGVTLGRQKCCFRIFVMKCQRGVMKIENPAMALSTPSVQNWKQAILHPNDKSLENGLAMVAADAPRRMSASSV